MLCNSPNGKKYEKGNENRFPYKNSNHYQTAKMNLEKRRWKLNYFLQLHDKRIKFIYGNVTGVVKSSINN